MGTKSASTAPAGGLIAWLEPRTAIEWGCKTLALRLFSPPSTLFRNLIGAGVKAAAPDQKSNQDNQSKPQWKACLDRETGAMYFIDGVSGARTTVCPRELMVKAVASAEPEPKSADLDLFSVGDAAEVGETAQEKLNREEKELEQTACKPIHY